MASSLHSRTDGPNSLAAARPGRRTDAVLPAADYDHLVALLDTCERDRAPFWTLLAYVLRVKIVNSEPCRGPVGRDVVVGGSQVSWVAGRGAMDSGLLMRQLPPAPLHPGKVPVASLLGATLIGMRIGQRAPLLCQDGSVTSLVVVDTVPPV